MPLYDTCALNTDMIPLAFYSDTPNEYELPKLCFFKIYLV